VGKTPPEGWSHLILAAYPRVASGDVDEVFQTVLEYGSQFTFAIVANVARTELGQRTEYRLDKVAMGIGTKVGGRNTIISSQTQADLGANLGFVSRQVLSANEESMQETIRQVVRTPTMLVYDAETVFLHRGEHRKMVIRQVVLVSATDGRLGSLVWLLEPADSSYQLAEETMCFLPPNLQEDRVLNVDADKFFLGIPAGDAFAMVRLPPGTRIRFVPSLRRLAAIHRFSAETAQQLEAELWKLWKK
jgi:hypothetical protein